MGNPEPLVSIVMAVQNEELYLEQCIDSILAQTYPNWELIAVNDHSKDRTLEILKTYAIRDPRIRVFNGRRHKLIPTLQEAYRHCKGTLINRMDADDYMPDYKLEVLVKEWNKYGKGTIITGATSHFVEKGEVGEGFKRYDRWLNDVIRRNAHYEEIYQECVIPSHCWIIHREDFHTVGAFDPEVYPEDYDLCFRFYRKGLKVVGIDKILHYWRDHPVRISRTWDCYQDNRYFELKLQYFYEIDRDIDRPLVLWGAGKNGKDLVKLLLEKENFQISDPASMGEGSPFSQEVPLSPAVGGNPGAERKSIFWVCDNRKKIGKEIYGIQLEHYKIVPDLDSPQILIVVNSPEERTNIRKKLQLWNKQPVKDFWFFT